MTEATEIKRAGVKGKPLVLVKKSHVIYRVCINLKELKQITVFDPEPMMSSHGIFSKLAWRQFYSNL